MDSRLKTQDSRLTTQDYRLMTFDFLQQLGQSAAFSYWLPLAMWTAISLLVLGLLHWRKHWHPAVQHNALWALLLALPLGLGFASWIESPFSWNSAETVAPIRPNLVAPRATPVSQAPRVTPLQAQPLEALPQTIKAPSLWETLFALSWQSWLWMALGVMTIFALFATLWYLARLAYDLWELRQFRKKLVAVEDADLKQLFQQLLIETKLSRRRISLMQHPDDISPLTFGWWKPIVVVSRLQVTQLDELRMALWHELTHIRRHDFLLHLLARWIQVPFAAHPLVSRLVLRLEETRELVCDAEVLRKTDVPKQEYANMLYRLTSK